MCSSLPCTVLCVGCGGEVTVHADRRVTFLPPIRCVRCTLRLPSVNPLLTPTVRCPDCGTEQSVDTYGTTKVRTSNSSTRAWRGPELGFDPLP
jgi:DNA-directed RNA polymerase subunit RPC12/RpoP